MNDPRDTDQTADVSQAPADSLDAGLAAAFGRPAHRSQSVRTNSRGGLGALPSVLLREVEGDSGHVVRPNSDAMPKPAETGDRYQLAGEIARGGMGAVLRGRDVDLGRDLAIKVLLEKYVDRPEIARRFIEEAQIGGQLQHPGVVPVYDIGRFGDRPFFTMKLVKGRTLAAILSERTGPADDQPRLLAIALQVAQTLAYAHAKGVIHRDLKPANIMVGAFGEVQVMDWGLAKVLAQGGIVDEEQASRAHQQPEVEPTVIRTARSGSAGSFGSDTEAGSLLGTPAYMPPEQANGDVVHLDRRADVFGLGAILCEILTGKPAYVGRSAEEVRRKAANGDLADARSRLDACGADAELIALTNACLSPEAIDRPKDAQAVTVALTAYLDGVQERLHRAELDKVAALARADEEIHTRRMAEAKTIEERKRRRAQLALAAAVTALFGTVGGGLWLHERQKVAALADRAARQAGTVGSITESLVDARQRIAEAWNSASFPDRMQVATDAASAAVRRADAYAASGEPTTESRVEIDNIRMSLDDLLRHTRLVADHEWAEQQLARWDDDQQGGGEVGTHVRREKAEVLRFGLDPLHAPEDQVAREIASDRLRDTLLGIFSTWQSHVTDPVTKDRLGRVIRATRLKCGGAYARWQNLLDQNDMKGLATFSASPEVIQLGPLLLGALARDLKYTAKDHSASRNLLRAAVDRYPSAIWIRVDMAMTYETMKVPEHIEAFRHWAALVTLKPDVALFHHKLGHSYSRLGADKEAIVALRKSMDLRWDQPCVELHLLLAKTGEAIPYYRKAVEQEPKSATWQYWLGTALRKKGRHAEARDAFAAAVSLAAATLALEPKLADNLQSGYRYNAACYAALAVSEGDGAVRLDEKERTRLYQQALSWLRADLDLWTKQAASGMLTDGAVVRTMQHWQQDSDLAGIRDKNALAKMPTKESEAFQKLWIDVESLLKKSQEALK
jgi:serine/threonine-protein kinase